VQVADPVGSDFVQSLSKIPPLLLIRADKVIE
jgi:hypothetical protein